MEAKPEAAKFLAIDPGITTGYAFGELTPTELHCTVWQSRDNHRDFHRTLYDHGADCIIIEDFEYRRGQRDGLELFSVELIGVATFFAGTWGARLYKQKAATGKAYYTDPTLKKSNMYLPGVPHGVDALRHLLHWFTFGAGYELNNDQKFVLR